MNFGNGKTIEYKKQMTEVYKDQIYKFVEVVPAFKVANAVVHYDKTSPHMHLVEVTVKDGYENGMKKQVAKSQIFTKASLKEREVKEDFFKEWLEFRDETVFCEMTPKDKKYCIYFDEISEKILKNIPEQNKKYVKKQLDQLDKNFMNYLFYWNEKYYRNGFADVIELLEV